MNEDEKETLKDTAIATAIAFSPLIIEATKTIKFDANAVSIAMDVAEGGYMKYGGYHRLFGGHSIFDFSMWKEHGFAFLKEIGIDSLTPNGVPLPGVETLVKEGLVTPKFATNWLSLNIGGALCAALSMADTGVSIYKSKKNTLKGKEINVALKGVAKITTGCMTMNPFPIAFGTIDLYLAASQTVGNKVDFEFDLSPAPAY